MRSRKAFTVIELVMVMVIIAILSAVTVVSINNALAGIQLSSAAEKVASDLRYAQTTAYGTGTWYGASFGADPSNQYTIYTTTGTVDTTVENPARAGSGFVIDLNDEFGVLISAVDISGGGKVEFNPLGTPYDDRTGAAISVEGVVTLAKSSSTRTVRITAGTGRIYIQ